MIVFVGFQLFEGWFCLGIGWYKIGVRFLLRSFCLSRIKGNIFTPFSIQSLFFLCYVCHLFESVNMYSRHKPHKIINIHILHVTHNYESDSMHVVSNRKKNKTKDKQIRGVATCFELRQQRITCVLFRFRLCFEIKYEELKCINCCSNENKNNQKGASRFRSMVT